MPLSGWLYLVVPKISISIGGPIEKNSDAKVVKLVTHGKRRVAKNSGGSSTSFAVRSRLFHIFRSRQWGSWKRGGFFHICSQLLFSLPSSYQLEAIFLRIISFAMRSWTRSAPTYCSVSRWCPILPWVSDTGASTVIQQSRKPPVLERPSTVFKEWSLKNKDKV